MAIIGIGTLLTSLYLQSESFVGPLVTAIAAQSWLLGALLLVLAWSQGAWDLAVLAGLTVAVRGLVIPTVLRRQIRAFRWRAREHQAAHRVTGHALAAVALALVGWYIYSLAVAPAVSIAGGALPFILLLEGFLLLATRRNTMVQVIGYIEEENAIVYFGSLFLVSFPLFVEAVLLLDLLGVVLVSVILSIQRRVVGIPEQAVLEELKG